MNIVIDSTRGFEEELTKLDEKDKIRVINKINDCASLLSTQKANVYRQLRHLNLPLLPKGYESSLYILRVSPHLRVILTLDEDPIFEQIILTLFRVFRARDFEKVYRSIANSLYQEFIHEGRELVKIP